MTKFRVEKVEAKVQKRPINRCKCGSTRRRKGSKWFCEGPMQCDGDPNKYDGYGAPSVITDADLMPLQASPALMR